MKKRSFRGLLLAVVLLLTVAAAVFHLSTRKTVLEGYIQLTYAGKETTIALSDFRLYPVQGTIINGKGEQRTVDAEGIAVADVLEFAGITDFTRLTVTAEDAYHADLTAAEAEDTSNTYFILQETGGVQLIVFCDSNSKRCVSDVVLVEEE